MHSGKSGVCSPVTALSSRTCRQPVSKGHKPSCGWTRTLARYGTRGGLKTETGSLLGPVIGGAESRRYPAAARSRTA